MPAQRLPRSYTEQQEFPVHRRRPLNRFQMLLLCIFSIALGFCILAAVLKLALGVPNASLPTVYSVGKGVAIFDRYNNHVTTVYADKDRKPVALSQISMNVRNALLAAEDHNFFHHHGIDIIGTARALTSNMRAGHVVEGGSTITQQLVRNLYLDIEDRSIKRKLAEAVLAIDVENNYSKAKILETYLNEVYFGNGVYGIERASEVYFNKHASELSIAESAFIAGLIKAPSDLGSSDNRQAAIRRQQEVLDKMVSYGLAPQHDIDVAKKQKLHFARTASSGMPYPYYVSAVIRILSQNMPEDQIWGKGLKVYTYLDPVAQKDAESTLNQGIIAAPRGINQGALVTESIADGGVLALVGGVGDFRNHQFNRAMARHTVGSAFKPFVYLAAAINGTLKPESTIDDSPIALNTGFGKQYTPKNFDGKFLGTISVRDALALSRNVCAVRVADAVGIDRVIDTAKAAGITAPMDKNISLALGSCAVSPLEMTTAYATLARYGKYVTPRLIRQVDNAQGSVVKQFMQSTCQTLPQEQVCEIVDVMQDVVQRGTGVQANLTGIAVAGKTGTADQARDIWFVGFTPDTVTAVWGGNDKYLPVRGNVSGGVVLAKVWHDYMSKFYKTHPAPTGRFVPPQTPFLQQSTASINSNVINEAQQYEQGLKESTEPDAGVMSSDQNAQVDANPVVSAPQPAPIIAPPAASSVDSPAALQPSPGTARSSVTMKRPHRKVPAPPGSKQQTRSPYRERNYDRR